jgi:hypothetical protein
LGNKRQLIEPPLSWGEPAEDGKWPIKVQFRRQFFNKKWADALVRIADGVGEFDSIVSGGMAAMPRMLCMVYWNRRAPEQLARPEFLYEADDVDEVGERHPWKAIKRFGTDQDFIADIGDSWLDGVIWYYHDASQWLSACELYHLYLKLRTYRAIEVVHGVHDSAARSGVVASYDPAQIRERLQEVVAAGPSDPRIPTFRDRFAPFDSRTFFDLVGRVRAWDAARSQPPGELVSTQFRDVEWQSAYPPWGRQPKEQA